MINNKSQNHFNSVTCCWFWVWIGGACCNCVLGPVVGCCGAADCWFCGFCWDGGIDIWGGCWATECGIDGCDWIGCECNGFEWKIRNFYFYLMQKYVAMKQKKTFY